MVPLYDKGLHSETRMREEGGRGREGTGRGGEGEGATTLRVPCSIVIRPKSTLEKQTFNSFFSNVH